MSGMSKAGRPPFMAAPNKASSDCVVTEATECLLPCSGEGCRGVAAGRAGPSKSPLQRRFRGGQRLRVEGMGGTPAARVRGGCALRLSPAGRQPPPPDAPPPRSKAVSLYPRQVRRARP